MSTVLVENASQFARGLLTRKRDVDPTGGERQPNPLRRRDAVNHSAILIAETCDGAAAGDGCTRRDRNVIATEVSEPAQISNRSAASDSRHTNIHY